MRRTRRFYHEGTTAANERVCVAWLGRGAGQACERFDASEIVLPS